MAGRHPFLGTCATYFEAPAFRFPRLEGFPEKKIYLERETITDRCKYTIFM